MRDKNSSPTSSAFNLLIDELALNIDYAKDKESASTIHPHLKEDELGGLVEKYQSLKTRVEALRDEWEVLVDFEGGGGE